MEDKNKNEKKDTEVKKETPDKKKTEETKKKPEEKKAPEKNAAKAENNSGVDKGKIAVVAVIAAICLGIVICAITGVFNNGNKKGGEVVTTAVVTDSEGKTVVVVQNVTDDKGNAVTDASGNNVTETLPPDAGQGTPSGDPSGSPEAGDPGSAVTGNGAINYGGDNDTPVDDTPEVEKIDGNSSSDGNTANYSYTFVSPDIRTTDLPGGGKATIEISYPQFSSSTANVAPLNDEIANKLAVAENNYSRAVGSEPDEGDQEALFVKYTVTSKIVTATDGIVSVLLTSNEARNTLSEDYYMTVNYDISKEKVLTISDLFPEDSDYDAEILSGNLGNGYQFETGRFLLSKEGLTVFASAPSSSELIQVTIPYSELEGKILDEYKLG